MSLAAACSMDATLAIGTRAGFAEGWRRSAATLMTFHTRRTQDVARLFYKKLNAAKRTNPHNRSCNWQCRRSCNWQPETKYFAYSISNACRC